MDAGQLSSAVLMLSGAAGIAIPDRVAEALDLPPRSARGRAETRAGLGGTYAALGAYACSTVPGARRLLSARPGSGPAPSGSPRSRSTGRAPTRRTGRTWPSNWASAAPRS